VQELRRVVEEHKLGALYRPGDPASLAAALQEVADNYATYAVNVRSAAPALSWEADAAVLREIYERFAPRGD
jgi:glycosyltransferase involved in cell wall biosynthesis